MIGVERLSDFTSRDDRGTAFIFGDGAGAAVISRSETAGIGPTIWGSDGEKWDAISQTESWIDVHEQGLSWPHIGMQGQTVFRWAVWGMAPVAQQALDAAGVTVDQLDAFIPHQANVRIVDAMAKQLEDPRRRGRRPRRRDTGNTSAASMPLAHGADACGAVRCPAAALALLIGFGAGLDYAAPGRPSSPDAQLPGPTRRPGPVVPSEKRPKGAPAMAQMSRRSSPDWPRS